MSRRARKPKAKTPPKSRWEKSADRENERRRARAPLFVATGIVPLATADERKALIEGGHAASERIEAAHREETLARAATVRARVAALVSPEVLAALDERAALVPAHEYVADFWHQQAVKAGVAATPPPIRDADRELELRRKYARQLPLFEPAPPMPEAAAPEPEPTPDPCPLCGWTGIAVWPAPKPIHPRDCLWLLGYFLGAWARCADCTTRRRTGATRADRGPCPTHLAAVTACRDGGHVAGPPPRDYLTGTYCSRCLVFMEAA